MIAINVKIVDNDCASLTSVTSLLDDIRLMLDVVVEPTTVGAIVVVIVVIVVIVVVVGQTALKFEAHEPALLIARH